MVLAGLAAACALEQGSMQPAFRVRGHNKIVYAEACPHPERAARLCAAKPSQDACEAVALCQWVARSRDAQCRRRACRTQYPTLTGAGADALASYRGAARHCLNGRRKSHRHGSPRTQRGETTGPNILARPRRGKNVAAR